MDFVRTYSQVKSGQPFSMREVVRNLALDGLAMMSSSKDMATPRIQFLYIHHIFEDEIPALRDLLTRLSQQFEFISHGQAVERILKGDIDRPYVSISSDDGFKNNLAAGKVLAEFGISACFFINPELIGETDEQKLIAHCSEKLNFPPVEFLSWNEVSALQKMGHEIGSHTMSHINIAQHKEDLVKEDIQKTKAALISHCGTSEHFAWPYGLFSDFNAAAKKAVFDAGFLSCSSAERGCHVPSSGGVEKTSLCIRRDHIILDWKASHIDYFIRKSATAASVDNDRFPY